MRSLGAEPVCPALPSSSGHPPPVACGVGISRQQPGPPQSSSRFTLSDSEVRSEGSRWRSPGDPGCPPEVSGICAQIRPPVLGAQGRVAPSEWAAEFPLFPRPLGSFSRAEQLVSPCPCPAQGEDQTSYSVPLPPVFRFPENNSQPPLPSLYCERMYTDITYFYKKKCRNSSKVKKCLPSGLFLDHSCPLESLS